MFNFLEWISRIWCCHFHRQPMWPVHGKYICPDCLREYPTGWEAPMEGHKEAEHLHTVIDWDAIKPVQARVEREHVA